MISGRIAFVANIVGLNLLGHRTQRGAHPVVAPDARSIISEIEEVGGTALSPGRPARRFNLLALLKGTTF